MENQTSSTNGNTLSISVVTPEQTVLEQKALFAALPLFDGEIGIAPLRSPMIGRLGYGEMRITDLNGKVDTFYVDGGFVQVDDNAVSILTNRAIPADQVDENTAAEQVKSAMTMQAHTDELLAIRDRHLAQGRAQERVARRAK